MSKFALFIDLTYYQSLKIQCLGKQFCQISETHLAGFKDNKNLSKEPVLYMASESIRSSQKLTDPPYIVNYILQERR